MPNLPISSLPELAASALTTNAEFAVAQSGTTYKIKNGNLSPYAPMGGLYAQTSNSVTATTSSEISIIGSGVGVLSIPPNSFSVGDSFSSTMGGKISTTNDDIRIRIKSGSVVLADSGFFTPSATDDVWFLTLYFTVRSLGAATVASITTHGNFQIVRPSNLTVKGFAFIDLNNTTFDTTTLNELDITIEFSTSDSGNYMYSDYFVLNKLY